jgi:hypothetical protein
MSFGVYGAGQGADPTEDPWTKARLAKKARVEKNMEQHRKNQERGKRLKCNL